MLSEAAFLVMLVPSCLKIWKLYYRIPQSVCCIFPNYQFQLIPLIFFLTVISNFILFGITVFARSYMLIGLPF